MDIKNAFAGTLESGDILIQIAPSETGTLQVDLERCRLIWKAASLSNSESKLKK